MVSLSTWFRYIVNKLDYSVSINAKSYTQGQINNIEFSELRDSVWKYLLQGKLTYLHWNKGEEMAPVIGVQGGTLLVRKLPAADPTRVFVGDVVVLKDPEKSHNYLVRRLAAIEGCEMMSTDEKDEPFALEKDECWVLADNENLKPKESPLSGKLLGAKVCAYQLSQFYPTSVLTGSGCILHRQVPTRLQDEANDSRTFGPVPMTNIVGRVIYCLRTAVDHGPVQNSHYSMLKDSPVLEVELDVDEMMKNHKA